MELTCVRVRVCVPVRLRPTNAYKFWKVWKQFSILALNEDPAVTTTTKQSAHSKSTFKVCKSIKLTILQFKFVRPSLHEIHGWVVTVNFFETIPNDQFDLSFTSNDALQSIRSDFRWMLQPGDRQSLCLESTPTRTVISGTAGSGRRATSCSVGSGLGGLCSGIELKTANYVRKCHPLSSTLCYVEGCKRTI